MTLEQIAELVESRGLVPVVRAATPELALSMSKALLDGGIRILEITLTVPGAEGVIRELSRNCGPDVLVGAGTVISLDDARRCLDAGAQFIVSPGAVTGLVELAHARGAAAMPGALTPTEVINTHLSGADFVKVFPCSALGGAAYLKALKAPFPQVKLLPTGGVTLESMTEFLSAGASALGVGAALVDPQLFEREGAGAISALAERYVRRFEEARCKTTH